ncbi:MAG: hypothetical protein AVDCRST_MAG95-2160, partial [uncultured Adhaeribacter sp.]
WLLLKRKPASKLPNRYEPPLSNTAPKRRLALQWASSPISSRTWPKRLMPKQRNATRRKLQKVRN